MILRVRQALHRRWLRFHRTPFGCLSRVFIGRMFYGGSEPGADGLDLGIGVIVLLLAMPGLLASLLMFEKYGSLIRFLRGDGVFDPFTATLPDEYFFIALSMFVTGAAALWRWDSIFLDRRDYMNLAPLPISLRNIFFANLCAMSVLAGVFMLVVNAASLFFFPVAVAGSQNSFSLLLRYAAGHTVAVFAASLFSFWFVLAAAGLMMTLLSPTVFRGLSIVVRFGMAIGLLLLLVSSVTMPQLLSEEFLRSHHTAALLPPLSFVSIARMVWGRGGEQFVAEMTQGALGAILVVLFTSLTAYTLSFRKAFMRIPETPDAILWRRQSFSFLSLLRSPNIPMAPQQCASIRFAVRTLLRSDIHLQVWSGFVAIGLVGAAVALSLAPSLKSVVSGSTPSEEFLAVPLILGYCLVIGIRLAFDIPADLRANWIFRLWLSNHRDGPRPIARCVLLIFSVLLLAPVVFVMTLAFWGWIAALLHIAMLSVCIIALIELSLCDFRKIPFTCSYPPFKSASGVVAVAYLFGFIVFTTYIAEMEYWCLAAPWRAAWFVPLFAVVIAGLRMYRSRMLEMDKTLIFEEVPDTLF